MPTSCRRSCPVCSSSCCPGCPSGSIWSPCRHASPSASSRCSPSRHRARFTCVECWDRRRGTPAVVHAGNGHLRGMPTVSFTKAIDVWMATCLVFVFGSFIEYSVVNVLARREKTRRDAAAAAAAGTSAVVLPVPLHNAADQQTKVRVRS